MERLKGDLSGATDEGSYATRGSSHKGRGVSRPACTLTGQATAIGLSGCRPNTTADGRRRRRRRRGGRGRDGPGRQRLRVRLVCLVASTMDRGSSARGGGLCASSIHGRWTIMDTRAVCGADRVPTGRRHHDPGRIPAGVPAAAQPLPRPLPPCLQKLFCARPGPPWDCRCSPLALSLGSRAQPVAFRLSPLLHLP